MSEGDLLAMRIDEILSRYQRALQDFSSPLVATPECWLQCRSQGEAILLECAAALRGTPVRQGDLGRQTKEIGVRRAMQEIPIAESIRAGMLLWRVTFSALCQIMPADPVDVGIKSPLLVTALESLQHSIGLRLYTGAAAHEDVGLLRNLLVAEGGGALSKRKEDARWPAEGVSEGPLTGREQQILAEVANALTNREIARKLNITEGTVKRHLRNIFAKLGATSRVDAINKYSSLETAQQSLPPFCSSTRPVMRDG